jgi:signal transduction histidine kinase/CheY-like chemotaxis protein
LQHDICEAQSTSQLADTFVKGLSLFPGLSAVRIRLIGGLVHTHPPEAAFADLPEGKPTALPHLRGATPLPQPIGAYGSESAVTKDANVTTLELRTVLRLHGHVLLRSDGQRQIPKYLPFIESLVQLTASQVELHRQETALRRAQQTTRAMRPGRLPSRMPPPLPDCTPEPEPTKDTPEREAQIDRVVDAAPLVLYVYDCERRTISRCSGFVSQMLDRSTDEIMNQRADWLAKQVHAEDLPRLAEHHRKVQGASDGTVLPIEFRLQKANGDWLSLQSHDTPYERNAAGEVTSIVGVVLDVTTQRAAEKTREKLAEQLRHAQKLESLGLLAGGVAHDFNNLLAPILGFTDILLQDLPLDHEIREDLEDIREAADQAQRLTRQLLAIGRRQVLEFKLIDLAEVVENSRPWLRRVVRSDISLRVDITTQGNLVRADESAMVQVLMNLIINAQDAMPKGGRITITIGHENLSPATVGSLKAPLKPGNYVVLSVSDTGYGMDAETARQAFEPFFTTKKRNRGTGLGLPTVYGVARQHKGYAALKSVPVRGTTVTVWLPARRASAPPDRQSGEYVSPTEVLNGVVLLAEDDARVRKLVATMLRRLGLEVLVAEHGDAALAIAQQEKQAIDILLTDVIMPGINGIELFKQVSQLQPNLRVLYISGYSDSILAQVDTETHRVHFLPKPFTVDTLRRKLKQVLDESLSLEAVELPPDFPSSKTHRGK